MLGEELLKRIVVGDWNSRWAYHGVAEDVGWTWPARRNLGPSPRALQ
jgi:hypothetical protein